MKQCKCGGIVRQHSLANGREAWKCGCCSRYEIVQVAVSDVKNQDDIGLEPVEVYESET